MSLTGIANAETPPFSDDPLPFPEPLAAEPDADPTGPRSDRRINRHRSTRVEPADPRSAGYASLPAHQPDEIRRDVPIFIKVGWP